MPQPDYRAIAHISGKHLMDLRWTVAQTLRLYLRHRRHAADRTLMWQNSIQVHIEESEPDPSQEVIANMNRRVEEWKSINAQWGEAVKILRFGLAQMRKQ